MWWSETSQMERRITRKIAELNSPLQDLQDEVNEIEGMAEQVKHKHISYEKVARLFYAF